MTELLTVPSSPSRPRNSIYGRFDEDRVELRFMRCRRALCLADKGHKALCPLSAFFDSEVQLYGCFAHVEILSLVH